MGKSLVSCFFLRHSVVICLKMYREQLVDNLNGVLLGAQGPYSQFMTT